MILTQAAYDDYPAREVIIPAQFFETARADHDEAITWVHYSGKVMAVTESVQQVQAKYLQELKELKG